jgi:hypothetical protein
LPDEIVMTSFDGISETGDVLSFDDDSQTEAGMGTIDIVDPFESWCHLGSEPGELDAFEVTTRGPRSIEISGQPAPFMPAVEPRSFTITAQCT